MSAREAKEFLISKIVEEAHQQGAPLDDVERRMLYFTETAWMPEDTWQANEVFERDYDQSAYEYRIAHLASMLKDNPEHALPLWKQAMKILSREDHYLLVLVKPQIQLQQGAKQVGIPKRLKYVLVSLGIGVVILSLMFVVASL